MQKREIQTSVLNFYSNNDIKYENYTDDWKKQYEEHLDFDPRIHKPNLEQAVEEWLYNFEEEDRGYYLQMFEHFTYFTQQNFNCRIYCLKEYVLQELSGYPQDKIMIVFSESQKGFKSGASQIAAAWWKACQFEMKKSQLIEIYSKITMEDMADMDAIVFVDDIVATGVTLKLLVGFHYEIPNNTLCTFWRYGKEHVPLFERSGNQNISLGEIRDKKKKMRDNAYRMKSIEGKNESL